MKLWQAEPIKGAGGIPGTVTRAEGDELIVACGEGALRLRKLQRPGGRRLSAAEFLRGKALGGEPRGLG